MYLGLRKGLFQMTVAVLLSKDYEEVEAMTVVDMLRRAQIDVDIIATEGDEETKGAHGIKIIADHTLEDAERTDYDWIVTPGGMGGVEALSDNDQVIEWLQAQYKDEERWIASICASPIVLSRAGIAKDIEGTVFPGLDVQVDFKSYENCSLVVSDDDHHVITSQGPGTAAYFAVELIRHIKGEDAAGEVRQAWLLPNIEAVIKEK